MKRFVIERLIGAAIEVHRELRPGLLESVYEQALVLELADSGTSILVIIRVFGSGQWWPELNIY